jgi:hypothetical protein
MASPSCARPDPPSRIVTSFARMDFTSAIARSISPGVVSPPRSTRAWPSKFRRDPIDSASFPLTLLTTRSGSPISSMPSVTRRISSPSLYTSMTVCCAAIGTPSSNASTRFAHASSRYLYLVPYNNGTFDGVVARYDSTGDFERRGLLRGGVRRPISLPRPLLRREPRRGRRVRRRPVRHDGAVHVRAVVEGLRRERHRRHGLRRRRLRRALPILSGLPHRPLRHDRAVRDGDVVEQLRSGLSQHGRQRDHAGRVRRPLRVLRRSGGDALRHRGGVHGQVRGPSST